MKNSEKFEKYKIKEYTHWTLYLYKNQYYLGRAYIWAKREDAIDFMQMNDTERKEFFHIGKKVNKVLDELFQPDLMNYAVFGNVTPHLHIHIIPRYASPRTFDGIDFTDEKWGSNYTPYNYDFKIPKSTQIKIRDAIKKEL